MLLYTKYVISIQMFNLSAYSVLCIGILKSGIRWVQKWVILYFVQVNFIFSTYDYKKSFYNRMNMKDYTKVFRLFLLNIIMWRNTTCKVFLWYMWHITEFRFFCMFRDVQNTKIMEERLHTSNSRKKCQDDGWFI